MCACRPFLARRRINVDLDFGRFESLEPEMNNQASRVAVVNQIARQLMHNGHSSEKDIKTQQDKLNNRYTEVISKNKSSQCQCRALTILFWPLGGVSSVIWWTRRRSP